MNSRRHTYSRSPFALRDFTPEAIVHWARIAVLAIGVCAVHGYLGGAMTDRDASEIVLALGLAVLVAAPGQRRVELLGAVAIWVTTCEFMAASQTGQFALWRWGSALAALALTLIMMRVPRFRAAARANPWRPLSEYTQRSPASNTGAGWQERPGGNHTLADRHNGVRRISAG